MRLARLFEHRGRPPTRGGVCAGNDVKGAWCFRAPLTQGSLCLQTLRIETLERMLAFQYFQRHLVWVPTLSRGATALAGADYTHV